MEITGTIFQILHEETGEGRNGPWKKQSFILETEDQYPRKVCITAWGDKIDLKSFRENEKVTASINIESREFNERWYTDVKVWRLVKTSQDKPAEGGTNQPLPETQEIPPASELDESDDLPF